MYFKSMRLPCIAVTGPRSFVAGLSVALLALSGQAHAGADIRVPANLCAWEVMGWRDLNGAERLTWSGLGWTMQTWHHTRSDNYPASYRKSWIELSDKERLFAGKLGFDQEAWDTDECPNYSTLVRNNTAVSEHAGTTGSID